MKRAFDAHQIVGALIHKTFRLLFQMRAFERTASVPSAVQTVTNYLTPESWAGRQLFSTLHKIEPTLTVKATAGSIDYRIHYSYLFYHQKKYSETDIITYIKLLTVAQSLEA